MIHKRSSRHFFLVSIAMLALLLGPTVGATNEGGFDWRGLMDDLGEYFDSARSGAVNMALGVNLRKQLNDLERGLHRESRLQIRSEKELRASLASIETLRASVDKIEREYPGPEELDEFQNRVTSALTQLFDAVEQQGEQLEDHEERLRDLQERLAAIESLLLPIDVPSLDLPGAPRVAVLALGEPTFAGAFEAHLEERLRARGVDAASIQGSLRVTDLLYRYGDRLPPIEELVPVVAAEGFHVLVLVRVEVNGYRELRFLGRSSEATTSRVRLDAFVLQGQRPLGRGWSAAVEYTVLNAALRAQQTLRDLQPDLVETIQQGWLSHRERLGG